MTKEYEQIFKRKSFHIFRNTETISEDEIKDLREFISTVNPLDTSIKTQIDVVVEEATTCHRGAQYCILFYSEKKGNYLRNIGYIGEQIDLYCSAHNIGALWFGIGKPKKMVHPDMEYVILIAIAKMPEDKFRKDMFKSKRKIVEEFWSGDTLGVAEIVRFTPSACNTQPWIVENLGDTLKIYRYKKPGKRGIMPADKVRYYNRIDVGIFMYMLEVCLKHEGYSFTSEQYEEDADGSVEKVLIATYKIEK